MSDIITPEAPPVRNYVATFPTVFTSAQGSILENANGFRFIDFVAGAGDLNYGHNNPRVKQALLDYINKDGVQYSCGIATSAQVEFLRDFENIILSPRNLKHDVRFIESAEDLVDAAIELARKITGRSNVVTFFNAYHGHSPNLTLQKIAKNGRREYFDNVTRLPYDGYVDGFDSCNLLDKVLDGDIPRPAAVVLETIQCQGGIHVASVEWLRRVAETCRRHDVLLIVDDTQVGNGRTGRFFSFEEAEVVPDMACVAKSIAGGLPLSFLLVRSDIDLPYEPAAAFCGSNLALVAARALLDYWRTDSLVGPSAINQGIIEAAVRRIESQHATFRFDVRGRGMIWGIDVHDGELANGIVRESFQHGLLIETVGAAGQVIKLCPALTIEPNELQVGLRILDRAFAVVTSKRATPLDTDTCDFNMDATTVCDNG